MINMDWNINYCSIHETQGTLQFHFDLLNCELLKRKFEKYVHACFKGSAMGF